MEQCLVCGSEALYLQRDFNRRVGLAIVLLGSLVIFWNFLWGIAILFLMALLDLVLYRVLPEVTVCYSCKSVYRGGPRNPQHRAYELTVDEAFEGSGHPPRVVEADRA